MQSFMENNSHPDISNGEVSLGESECPFAPAAQRHTAAGASLTQIGGPIN